MNIQTATARDRIAGRVGPGPQGAAREGEGAHPAARRAEPAAPRAALGEGREELRLRGAGRQGDARGSLRRPQPADRLSLHVRSGVAGGLPQLLDGGRSLRRQPRPPRPAGRDAGRRSRGRRLDQIEAFQKRMGWSFKWVSSYGNDFNRDYHVSFTKDEMAQGKVPYNYGLNAFPSEEAPGVSVFYKDGSGEVFHTYSAYARGVEELLGVYRFLDFTPKGRDEAGLPFPMAWVRHHDRYEAGVKAAPRCCAGRSARERRRCCERRSPEARARGLEVAGLWFRRRSWCSCRNAPPASRPISRWAPASGSRSRPRRTCGRCSWWCAWRAWPGSRRGTSAAGSRATESPHISGQRLISRDNGPYNGTTAHITRQRPISRDNGSYPGITGRISRQRLISRGNGAYPATTAHIPRQRLI